MPRQQQALANGKKKDAIQQSLRARQQLLRAAIECATTRGLRRLRLCTRPPMKAAQHLYAAAGFSRTPELDFEPSPGVPLQAYELGLLPLF